MARSCVLDLKADAGHRSGAAPAQGLNLSLPWVAVFYLVLVACAARSAWIFWRWRGVAQRRWLRVAENYRFREMG
eukprot:6194423-Pleurochrysis_carterae.AAC.1